MTENASTENVSIQICRQCS